MFIHFGTVHSVSVVVDYGVSVVVDFLAFFYFINPTHLGPEKTGYILKFFLFVFAETFTKKVTPS